LSTAAGIHEVYIRDVHHVVDRAHHGKARIVSDEDVLVLAGYDRSPGSIIASEDECSWAASCWAFWTEASEGAYSRTLSVGLRELLEPLLTHTALN
jgi:hypothetical protein